MINDGCIFPRINYAVGWLVVRNVSCLILLITEDLFSLMTQINESVINQLFYWMFNKGVSYMGKVRMHKKDFVKKTLKASQGF